ncbi:hypothetical protein GCM10009090_29170 [[Pseudomonas] boreopolis]|uniref:DUF2931 family protein n=2 Tax=Xanthomonas boreopolis TaxID=86183 RepID=A0A919KJF6_9XANT|nr:hypothetical protein GCM10009090_29170 [[Pseudomonas] boreopolis]
MLLMCLLTGCATAPAKARLPYDAWRLGFLAPHYMDVWTEDAVVEDVRGRVFTGYRSGTVAIAHEGDPNGWPTSESMGKGRDVIGADLPRRIYVRWQSLVEPQTYRVTLEIPERMRKLMLEKAESQAVPGKFDYQNAVVVGLAPGGWVKVWVKSPGARRVEVLCQQAEVEPKGPDQGEYGGRYVTLPAKAKEYIANNPIPFDSWKCPGT